MPITEEYPGDQGVYQHWGKYLPRRQPSRLKISVSTTNISHSLEVSPTAREYGIQHKAHVQVTNRGSPKGTTLSTKTQKNLENITFGDPSVREISMNDLLYHSEPTDLISNTSARFPNPEYPLSPPKKHFTNKTMKQSLPRGETLASKGVS